MMLKRSLIVGFACMYLTAWDLPGQQTETEAEYRERSGTVEDSRYSPTPEEGGQEAAEPYGSYDWEAYDGKYPSAPVADGPQDEAMSGGKQVSDFRPEGRCAHQR